MPPVHYCAGVEQVLDGEQQIIDQLGATSVDTQARMAVYLRTQDYRQAQNRAAPAEPASCDDVPD